MNCENRRVFIGDNREVMLGLNAEIADAIITDPPFNSGQMRKDGKIRIDKEKSKELGFLSDMHGQAIQQYSDKWKIEDITGDELKYIRYKDKDLLDFCSIVGRSHSSGMEAYLLFMADRLLLCHEILKETGSIFLHCDHSSNGYLRMLMDAIFGEKNFRNEIVWCYTGPSASQKQFPRKHETIFWYSKSDKWTFNADAVKVPYSEITMKRRSYSEGSKSIISASAKTKGKRGREEAEAEFGQGKVPESWWTGFATGGQMSRKERCKGWDSQKPLALYTRLVKAVTKPGDFVIDPFCGCATTLIAAENAECKWIGIDSDKARVKLIEPQLEKLTTQDLWKKEFKIIKDKRKFPSRTDNKLKLAERKLIRDEKALEQLEHRRYLYCVICEHPKDKFDLEVDHIQPKANRGGKESKNFQLVCSRCNRRKGSTKTNADVRRELRKERLMFDQRQEIHKHTGIPMPHEEEYLREEEKPKKLPRRNGKKAKKNGKRKNNQTGTLI